MRTEREILRALVSEAQGDDAFLGIDDLRMRVGAIVVDRVMAFDREDD